MMKMMMYSSSSPPTVCAGKLKRRLCRPPAGCKQPVHLLSPSDDGQWLAAANTGGEVHVYNLRKLTVGLFCLMMFYIIIYITRCEIF